MSGANIYRGSPMLVEDPTTIDHKKAEHAVYSDFQRTLSTTLLLTRFSLTKFEERDLLMQDFMTVESTYFPRNGSQQTPAHPHSEYTFRTYAPVAFRYFHKLFGIQREDFLVSSKYLYVLFTLPQE